jgi:bifunctional DNase/RNase
MVQERPPRAGVVVDVLVELSRTLITEFGQEQVIYLKEKDGERSFPILIGIPEALAIDRRWKNQVPSRPQTHELLASVIEAMGGELEKVVINDLCGRTFIATLHIRRGEEIIEVDSRPSDAIALGVGSDTPIFVAEHVLDEVVREPIPAEDRIELLRRRMRLLSEKISELSDRLSSQEFLAGASEDEIGEHRRQLNEMESEYEAIDRVLKKLG